MSTQSYIHKALPGSPGGPLLFVFHGTGGDEGQLIALGRDLAPDAAIVSPRGDVSEYGAARFFRRTGEGVYDMDDLARATAKMAGFVKAHVAAAKPSRVLGLGYSNGANILASVMFSDPALFDAVVLMHPLIPFEPDVNGDLSGKRVLDHRRPARSDLPAEPDVAPGSAFARPGRRCHSGMARGRP